MILRKTILVAAMVVAGCGGVIATDPDSRRSGQSEEPAPAPAAAAPSEAPAVAPPIAPPVVPYIPGDLPSACSAPMGRRVFHTSTAEVRAAIQGTWLRCSELGFGHEPQQGIEVVGDRWHVLRRDASGVLQPVHGPTTEGSLSVVDTTGMNGIVSFQTNIAFDSGSFVVSSSIFTADKFLFNNNLVYEYRYVRVDASSLPPLPTPSGAGLPAACSGAPGQPISPATKADVTAAVQGKWLRCSTDGLTATPHDGIEFLGDRWHLLQRDASDVLQPALDVTTEGTLEVLGDPGFPTTYRYDLGPFMPASTELATNEIRIRSFGGQLHRYVRAP